MLTINTNVASLNAQRNLSGSQSALSTSLQRLSSGLRINSAKDDAAGMAISERMSSQIRGMDQARRNANDGISLAQTAEGALGQISTNLQRIRELSVQAANDTNTATDRAALQQEVSQLQQEITRVAGTTQFNGKNLLDGTFTSQNFQVGANANQNISVSLNSAQATSLGNNTVKSVAALTTATAAGATFVANGVTAQTLVVSGNLGTANVAVSLADTSKTIASSINAQSAVTGVSAEARTQAKLGNLAAAGTLTFDLAAANPTASPVSITAQVASTSDLTTLADAINANAASTGVTAAFGATKAEVILTNANGENIAIQNFANSAGAGGTIDLTGMDAYATTPTTTGAAATLGAAVGTDSSTVAGTLRFKAAESFTVTSTAATVVAAATTASTLNSVASVNIGSAAGANNAIDVIDGALQSISNQRAALGAYQNRFTSTITNLQTSSENLNASRSRILDADFADETAKLSRNQVLQQAGTAMLAQANQLPQNVLSLLR